MSDARFLLDLLNTTPVVDGVTHDALADFAVAEEWMAPHQIPATETEWAALRAARSLLQAVVRGDAPATALQPLLDGVSMRPVLTERGLDWQLACDGERIGAARAVAAWGELQAHSPGRLRPCANTECHLFLLDRSKPNSARWCSMAVCGNRMKARRHYRRANEVLAG